MIKTFLDKAVFYSPETPCDVVTVAENRYVFYYHNNKVKVLDLDRRLVVCSLDIDNVDTIVGLPPNSFAVCRNGEWLAFTIKSDRVVKTEMQIKNLMYISSSDGLLLCDEGLVDTLYGIVYEFPLMSVSVDINYNRETGVVLFTHTTKDNGEEIKYTEMTMIINNGDMISVGKVKTPKKFKSIGNIANFVLITEEEKTDEIYLDVSPEVEVFDDVIYVLNVGKLLSKGLYKTGSETLIKAKDFYIRLSPFIFYTEIFGNADDLLEVENSMSNSEGIFMVLKDLKDNSFMNKFLGVKDNQFFTGTGIKVLNELKTGFSRN